MGHLPTIDKERRVSGIMNRTGNGYFDDIEHIVGGVTSVDTHTTPWFAWIWDRHCPPRAESVIVDPFARDCTWGTITNDIDPTTQADYHYDALEFLGMMKTNSVNAVIFDPPFSVRQANEKYEAGRNVYTIPGYVKNCMKEIVRILRPGGILVKCGWNSTRHNLQLEPVALYVVNTGGNHNDISISIWRIGNERLDV